MSETPTPEWLPEVDESLTPEPQQDSIIKSDDYPMRVLAGAGTGKTFTMVRKIEHLIDERNVSPDRILALTFTNNAANSMREKLNAKLGTAGYDIDAYTYHSICNEILSEHAYEAGIDPEFEIVSEAEKYAVVLEILDEVEYRTVKPNVYGPNSHGTGAASNLLSYISTMKNAGVSPQEADGFLGSAERLYEIDDIPGKIEEAASEHLGGRSVSSVLDGIPDVRAEIVEQRRRLNDEEGVEASVARFLNHLIELCDSFEDTFQEHEDGERNLSENVHKLPKYLLGGYASGAPKGVPSMNLELPELLDDFLDDCKTARDLNAGYAAYEHELADRNLLDFDDLVSNTVELFETDTRSEIAERWDYVFCDEFQDTDRLQFDLVTSLVTDDRLFVVGDDDQAIYEWRGAHVANITDELDETYGDGIVDEALEDNFRSRQPILDLANVALRRLRGEDGKTLKRVHEPDYDGDTVAVVREADEEEERAEQTTTVIKNLLRGEADELDETYSPGDIAILVRKRKHAKPIIERFDDEGVPYKVAGGISADSVGVGTVVAYLKALARPGEDEVSWNRVLTMRYRLNDADLRLLNSGDSLLEKLLETPLEEFEERERVREAREDAEYLLELRDRVSLGYLYREMKETTNIEWYLSEQDRRNLSQLDGIIDDYGDGAVQPSLSEEFIETLRRQETVLQDEGSAPTSQPDLSEDAVNIMTIHKSKGLDFPVVMIPRLTADEWEPRSRSYDAVEEGLVDSPEAAFEKDFVERDCREARRLLHVGITRTEDVLVLQGGVDDDNADDGDVREFAQEVMTGPWEPKSHRLPIWNDIQDALPSSASDWTDSLAAETVGEIGGRVSDGDDSLSTEEGRERVLALARSSMNGDAEIDQEPKRSVVELEALTEPSKPSPAVRHSYTSLETYERCPRQHYLDYVVNAFPDYSETDTASGGVSQRDVGVLFHDTAEIASQEGKTDKNEWYEVCERLAGQKRAEDALEEAKDCIDRYFDLGITDWEVVDAERKFGIDVEGHELVGMIDAVYRKPDGELVVVDYKATERRRDLNEDKQLPIYLIACRDLYDEPVRRAGYAYVGEIGPELDIRRFDKSEVDEALSEVTASMGRISEASFEEYKSGDHCQWCQHNQLPCAPDGINSGRQNVPSDNNSQME